MADIRINSLPSTATSFNTDDYIAIDGASGGTRKMLAAALPLTDVTLGGTSGPSVKSTLSARAPRQGLVQSGTFGSTFANTTIIGTGAFTYSFWLYQPSAGTGDIISGGVGSPGIYVNSTGLIGINSVYVSGGPTTSAGAYVAGKWAHVVYSRTSTATNGAAYYVNGVLVATVTDALNYYTAPTAIGKRGDDTNVLTGSVTGTYLYNRALSASEVVALYEAGAPAGADYNNATNTAFTNGTFANVGYSTFSGASATGFVATYGGGGEAAATSQIANLAVAPGRKYLIKFDLTLTSGTAPYVGLAQFGVQWLTGSAAVTTGQVRAAAGANSIVVTIRSVNATFATNAGVGFASQEASSFTVSNLTATPLGLLLAPDAAQAGGGLVWYDTSGNAANITLPASGVSWNVPSSAKTATGWTFGGNLTVSGTGTSSFAGSLSVGSASGGSGQNAITFPKIGGGSYANAFYLYNGNTDNPSAPGFALYDVTSAAWRMVVANSGNFLLGTTTDSGNGRVQLATHTTSAGGIGFGSGLSLFTSSTAGQLVLKDGSGTSPFLAFYDTSNNNRMAVGAIGTTSYVNSVAGPLQLWSSNTLALTLDSSQNATFAGDITISSAYPKINLTDTNNNSDFSVLNDNGRLAIYDETNAAYRFTVGATGGIKIGSTPEDVGANNLKVQGNLTVSGTGGFGNTVSITKAGGAILELNDSNQTARIRTVETGATHDLAFWAESAEKMRLKGANGNLLIGTTTDAGYKLQVTGTAQFTFGGSDTYFGYGATNDIYLTNGNSGKTVIRNATGTENLVINNTGATFAGNASISQSAGSSPQMTFVRAGTQTQTLKLDSADGLFKLSGADVYIANNLTMAGGTVLQIGSNYTAGAPTATGYVTIKATNGVTYKVLVGT